MGRIEISIDTEYSVGELVLFKDPDYITLDKYRIGVIQEINVLKDNKKNEFEDIYHIMYSIYTAVPNTELEGEQYYTLFTVTQDRILTKIDMKSIKGLKESYYDRNSGHVEFKVGDKVKILDTADPIYFELDKSVPLKVTDILDNDLIWIVGKLEDEDTLMKISVHPDDIELIDDDEEE